MRNSFCGFYPHRGYMRVGARLHDKALCAGCKNRTTLYFSGYGWYCRSCFGATRKHSAGVAVRVG